jgi:hypothetical protein
LRPLFYLIRNYDFYFAINHAQPKAGGIGNRRQGQRFAGIHVKARAMPWTDNLMAVEFTVP